jgi:hypothetical protein
MKQRWKDKCMVFCTNFIDSLLYLYDNSSDQNGNNLANDQIKCMGKICKLLKHMLVSYNTLGSYDKKHVSEKEFYELKRPNAKNVEDDLQEIYIELSRISRSVDECLRQSWTQRQNFLPEIERN